MKILAIDSTSISASCAVVSREKLYGEYTINHPKTHSQKLMPMIEHLMAELELGLDEIDAIAVANGPGSFTGIRIGLSTAKGLAQPHKLPVIEVSSLMGLAFNYYGYNGLICPIMDARRDEVYTGIYRVKNNAVEVVMEETAMHPVLLAEKLNVLMDEASAARGEKVMILGDGTFRYKSVMEDVLGDRCEFSSGAAVMQKASSVGMAALVMGLELKSFHDVDGNYLRNSEAEDTMAQRKQKKLEDEKQLNKAGAKHE